MRGAVVADALALATVQSAAWREAYADLFPPDFLAAHTDTGQRAIEWGARLAQATRPQRTFVAVLGGTVAGFVSVGVWRGELIPDAVMGEVYALYVDPARWRRGVGTTLIGRAEEALREDGLSRVRLWVVHGNTRALRFYRHHGWYEDGRWRPVKATGRYEQLLVRDGRPESPSGTVCAGG